MDQKRKTRNLFFGLVLFLAMLFCVATYQKFLHDCFWWECAPERSFSLHDLNLPDYLFELNANTEKLRYSKNDLAVDAAIAFIQWDNGTASYSVRRFSSNANAISEYDFQTRSNIFTAPINITSEVLDILNYRSPTANESNVQCGYVINDLRCLFIARYQEFTITFNSTIETNGMSNEDYLHILQFIDNNMDQLIN